MKQFQQRIERVREVLQKQALDAVLVMSPAGSCYLSGCYLLTQTVIPERQAYVLVTADGRVCYIVCNIEEHSARHESWIEEIDTYVEFVETPVQAVARVLKAAELTSAHIGVETHTMPAAAWQFLHETLPHNHYQPFDQALAKIMMLKDQTEIDALEAAGRHTQAIITRELTTAAPNSPERTIAKGILSGLMDEGVLPMFNVFAAGPHALTVHATATERILQTGDIVRLDMGGRYPSHYLSDMARTAVVGSPTPEQQAIYHKLYQTQAATFAAVRPGRSIADLFNVCRQTYEKLNLPFIMPHIGHSMGIGLHEPPLIHPGNDTILQAGMVLNIEPFVAVPERGESYHIEDLILVTENGGRLLTEPQESLIVIPA